MTVKLENINRALQNVWNWRTVCELHWERLLGEFHNDKDFWNDLFHSMQAEDWQDVITIAHLLQLEEPQELRRFTRFDYNVEVVEKRLHKCEPVIKPHNRQGYNSAAVSVFMAVRDVLNELKGSPTKTWSEKERAKILADRELEKKPARVLFEVE